MYADTGARGGVLEPEGMVEIKFRAPELRAAMARMDPVIRSLKVHRSLFIQNQKSTQSISAGMCTAAYMLST